MEQPSGQQPALLPDQLPDGGCRRRLHCGVSVRASPPPGERWARRWVPPFPGGVAGPGVGGGWVPPFPGGVAGPGVGDPFPGWAALRLGPVPRERARAGPGGPVGWRGVQGSCLSFPLPLLKPLIYLLSLKK